MTHNQALVSLATGTRRVPFPVVKPPVTISTGMGHSWLRLESVGTPVTWSDYGTENVAGTPHGSVNPPWQVGTAKFFGAVDLATASAQYIQWPDSPFLRMDRQLTFTLWVRLKAIGAGLNTVIFSKRDDAKAEYELRYVGDLARFCWFTYSNDASGAPRLLTVQVGGAIQAGVWYFLCCGYNPKLTGFSPRTPLSFCSLNAGAVLTTNLSNATGAITPGADLRLGASGVAASPAYFNGYIEQFTIHDRLLTETERLALWTNPLANLLGATKYPHADPSGGAWVNYETDMELPAAPSDLEFTSPGDVATLAWTNNAANIGDFLIYRNVDGGSFDLLATIKGDVLTYSDTTADLASHVYQYKLKAQNRTGTSAYSGTVTSPASATVVDWLLRMDTANANGTTPTVGQLDAATFGLALGTWSKVGADNIWVSNTSEDVTIEGLSLSGGSGAGDATTRCFARSLASNGGTSAYPLFTFSASKSAVTVGFAFKLTGAVDEFDIYNLVRLDTSGGNFFSCTIEIDGNTAPDTLKVNAHAGAADGSPVTGLALDTWYWVTMQLDNTTTARLRVYSLPDLVQQGSESVATRGGSDACTAIRCGMTDPTGATAAGSTLFWDDIAFDTADDGNGPTYPLLPT